MTMATLIPFFSSANSIKSSKRKCAALVPKAAPTCTLSLTSVSVSAHGSSDSLNFIPFPSAPASVPFPSSSTNSTSPTKCSSTTTSCPRPRVRTQASLLRRKRSFLRLGQLYSSPCSSQVESEPDQVVSTPPRKRARKASISSPSTSSSITPTATFHSLSVSLPSLKKGRSSKRNNADLRFLCTVYRSTMWLRFQRDLSEATRCPMEVTDSIMDVDTIPKHVSVLEAQESLLLSRLRSYLIVNEMSPQCLDVAPSSFDYQEVDHMDMDIDIQESNSFPTFSPQLQLQTPPPQLPIMTQEQITASLLFRFRQRLKVKSRPEAPGVNAGGVEVRKRRHSPLAGPTVSSFLDEP